MNDHFAIQLFEGKKDAKPTPLTLKAFFVSFSPSPPRKQNP